ncbi:MAG: type II toxin-antitoxin system VapC family toxin [Spongiibacteraceae bacterium]
MRRKSLTLKQAAALQAEAEQLLAEYEYEVDSRAVLELVRDSDCSAYDCEFIALAKKLDSRLVTMDKKLLKAFSGRAVALNAVYRST